MNNRLIKIKKTSLWIFLVVLLIFLSSFLQSAAAAQTGSAQEEMILQTMKHAHISAVSAASVSPSETTFFSFGEDQVSEHSLFYIGSVSKSFTAFAVLYLVELEQLSLDDPITKHIPWFEAMYQGKNVADAITIADLLYQTSGFTNNEKFFPKADLTMDLADNIRNLSGRELIYGPSVQFAYANTNYNLLGYIIEQVSGRSYADFMEAEIFTPLGLTNTFASLQNTKEVPVPGTRLSFGRTWDYAFPVSEGSVPAGYLLSCGEDLSRWLQIHLGTVEIPPVYGDIVQQSHQPSESSVVNDHTHYAAGWFVDDLDGKVYHSGGTPNYSSRLVLDMENKHGACVLTNMNASANTDDMANNMILLLQKNTEMSYRQDIWTIMDGIYSVVTAACLIFTALVLFIMGKNRQQKKRPSKLWYALHATALVLATASISALPAIFDSPWQVIVVWAPPSIAIAIVALILSALVSFLSVYNRRRGKLEAK